jgi:predicted amidohydrolase
MTTSAADFSTKLKVAVVQFAPITSVEDATARNLERMDQFVERAWAEGAKLILFPELGTSGYGIDGE